MANRIFAVRGMNDCLPEETPFWQSVESTVARCFSRYGYQEIRFPLVESTDLFKRSMGEVTDVVEKEMYTFTDLNGDSLTLRPEGTAGCLRAVLEHGLLHNQQQKLWYMGPMFRHEKPQKGRYRQFHQWGVEALGFSGYTPELELLALSKRLFEELDVLNLVRLEINTLGELAERKDYREKLIAYLETYLQQLDEDSQRRLYKNPLRILDSKHPQTKEILKEAPTLWDSLKTESRERFEKLCEGLTSLGISYTVNPRLVRGLDYYGHTVFEWVSDELGSQGTISAGGRYDNLIAELGGKVVPAVGFGIGAERLMMLVKMGGFTFSSSFPMSIYMISEEGKPRDKALSLAEMLRDAPIDCQIITHLSEGNFKSQFKKADKSGVTFALIIGEEELARNEVSLKALRTGEQHTLSMDEVVSYLQQYQENMHASLHD